MIWAHFGTLNVLFPLKILILNKKQFFLLNGGISLKEYIGIATGLRQHNFRSWTYWSDAMF